MTPVLLVHGTWDRSGLWCRPGSDLWSALQARGFPVLRFAWSGYLGGVPSPTIVPPSTNELKGSLELWRCAGEKLHLFCRLAELARPHVVCHSHGLQLVCFAADGGQDFDTVLSLSGPVREDMRWVRERARPHIRRWVQVVDPSGHDATIIEGETFDGEWGWHFDLPEA